MVDEKKKSLNIEKVSWMNIMSPVQSFFNKKNKSIINGKV